LAMKPPMPRSRPWTNTPSSPLQKAGSPVGQSPQGPFGPSSPPPEQGGSFPAIIDDQRFIPPDTMGAIGPGHVMTTLNSEVAIQTRQGNPVSKVTTAAFWNSLGHAEVFDRKMFYDL